MGGIGKDIIGGKRLQGFVALLIFIIAIVPGNCTDILDNTCTFRVEGRLFVLTFLNLKDQSQSYYLTNS